MPTAFLRPRLEALNREGDCLDGFPADDANNSSIPIGPKRPRRKHRDFDILRLPCDWRRRSYPLFHRRDRGPPKFELHLRGARPCELEPRLERILRRGHFESWELHLARRPCGAVGPYEHRQDWFQERIYSAILFSRGLRAPAIGRSVASCI